ncbi:MAG: hypothetical protein ACREP9_05730 [Candidatus Dormibacteraceae bacterium]
MESYVEAECPTQLRYPHKIRERAVRMVREAIGEDGGERHGVITRASIQLGVGCESLRSGSSKLRSTVVCVPA